MGSERPGGPLGVGEHAPVVGYLRLEAGAAPAEALDGRLSQEGLAIGQGACSDGEDKTQSLRRSFLDLLQARKEIIGRKLSAGHD